MPITVTAIDGDCLCGIAMDHGLIDCAKLRELSQNADYLARPLKAGDIVTVPDKVVATADKPVDQLHVFKVRNSPPVHIRFVHGSPDLPYKDDPTTTVLHVSNFVTNLSGADGLKPFPKTYGFSADGHQDPDAFKLEVIDPAACATR